MIEKIKRYSWIGWLFLVGVLWLIFKRRGDKLEKAVFELEVEKLRQKSSQAQKDKDKYGKKYEASLKHFLDLYSNADPATLGISPEQHKETLQRLRKRVN